MWRTGESSKINEFTGEIKRSARLERPMIEMQEATNRTRHLHQATFLLI